MNELKIHKTVVFTDPVMIAGWPGMGNVAMGAIDYLQRKLHAAKFAEIKVEPLTVLDSVVIEEGVAKFPSPPQNIFYYVKNPDIIIFKGEVQLPGKAGIDMLNRVLDFASEQKVKRIYTAAAFPLPVSHKESPEVYGAANKKVVTSAFSKFGIHLMEGGHISGLNGLLLGFAKDRDIEAMCLLATMPQYAINLPNPKASGAIIEMLQKMLNVKIDLHELSQYVKEMDEKMSLIEDKVKDVLTVEKESSQVRPKEKKVPGYIMEKIEKLFSEARSDKEKAIMLKKELDRWDLYRFYEDRFLDLFKDKQ